MFHGPPSRRFSLKLKALKVRLKVWSKSKFGSFKTYKEDCLAKIKKIDKIEESRILSVDEK